MDLGHLIEGRVVKTDKGSYVIRIDSENGPPTFFDPQTALAELEGQEVRLTLASFQVLDRIAQLLRSGSSFE